MQRPIRFAATAALTAACQVLAMQAALAQAGDDRAQPPTDDAASPATFAAEFASDPELATGITVYSPETADWRLRLDFPFSVGWTQLDLDAGIDLDSVWTLSVVPTLEFIVPVDEKWTFLPFAGAGGAAAVGDQKLVSGESTLGILTGGLRGQRWQPFADRYVSLLTVQGRYNAALTPRDGLLGDWGSLAGALEFRRSFGSARDGPRFQPGIYVQGFWFWDPVEFEIEGVTPSFLHNQREFGISLGGSTPYRILGIKVPRVFLGVRVGQGARSLQLRFGRL